MSLNINFMSFILLVFPTINNEYNYLWLILRMGLTYNFTYESRKAKKQF